LTKEEIDTFTVIGFLNKMLQFTYILNISHNITNDKQTGKLCLEDLNGADVHIELVNVMLTEVADAEAAMSMMNTTDWS